MATAFLIAGMVGAEKIHAVALSASPAEIGRWRCATAPRALAWLPVHSAALSGGKCRRDRRRGILHAVEMSGFARNCTTAPCATTTNDLGRRPVWRQRRRRKRERWKRRWHGDPALRRHHSSAMALRLGLGRRAPSARVGGIADSRQHARRQRVAHRVSCRTPMIALMDFQSGVQPMRQRCGCRGVRLRDRNAPPE